MKRIAILGASGHIGRSLTHTLAQNPDNRLFLFARKTEYVSRFLSANQLLERCSVHAVDEFDGQEYDTVINGIGAGDPGLVAALGLEVITLTEDWDNRIIEYLGRYPNALYISVSSGSIYNATARKPEGITAEIYAWAKCNSEAFHRSHRDLNIVDLRLFGYFSRFQDIEGQYFLSQAMSAIRQGEVLKTLSGDMTRDYVTPVDFVRMIDCCFNHRPINRAYDMFSQESVSKFQILEHLHNEFSLQWTTSDVGDVTGGALEKPDYVARERDAVEIGFRPEYSALDGVLTEFRCARDSGWASCS
jgi:nucleoside-diphosphate-sugar epimerase